jgi:hypothetical protein
MMFEICDLGLSWANSSATNQPSEGFLGVKAKTLRKKVASALVELQIAFALTALTC